MSLKQIITNNAKNIIGFSTKRKIVVFSVDDYGNVRLDGIEAKKNLIAGGMNLPSHFDNLDTMETTEDLEILFDALTSVKDKNNNPAVFTPFALPCNINFEAMKQNSYQKYEYELLDKTFSKLEDRHPKKYTGTWALWKEGLEKGLLRPQFHGREHLNLKIFNQKLKENDAVTRLCLENNSYTGIKNTEYPTISYTAAFDFWDIEENKNFEEIITSGTLHFESVFGYKPIHFNAPGATASCIINDFIFANGMRFIDNPIIKNEHLGFGKYQRKINYTGKKINSGLININRNVVFEPCEGDRDWVGTAMEQIESAFRWDKPAIISSHRVNFCGNIDQDNRKKGINSLRNLLKRIIEKWPEVEFMSSEELCRIIVK